MYASGRSTHDWTKHGPCKKTNTIEIKSASEALYSNEGAYAHTSAFAWGCAACHTMHVHANAGLTDAGRDAYYFKWYLECMFLMKRLNINRLKGVTLDEGTLH